MPGRAPLNLRLPKELNVILGFGRLAADVILSATASHQYDHADPSPRHVKWYDDPGAVDRVLALGERLVAASETFAAQPDLDDIDLPSRGLKRGCSSSPGGPRFATVE